MNFRTVLRGVWLPMGLVAAMMLSACSEQRATEVIARKPVASLAGTNAIYDGLTIDQVFNSIGTRVPSFAGAYFDSEGVLVVRLTRLADSAAAWAVLQDAMTKRARTDPRRGTLTPDASSIAPKGRRFEIAAVAFSKLFELKSRIEGKVFDSDDAVFLDLDEQIGRIVVGMTSTDAATKARSVLALSPEDDALLDMRTATRIAPAQALTLYYHQRPLTGGTEIGSVSGECSLTSGVRRGTEQLALTASHCTASTA